MKVKLDKAYFWQRNTYGPGEAVEVPDEFATVLGAGGVAPAVVDERDARIAELEQQLAQLEARQAEQDPPAPSLQPPEQPPEQPPTSSKSKSKSETKPA